MRLDKGGELMKVLVSPQGYRANATQINMMAKNNPFVLVFETVDTFYHCMTYFAARRTMAKKPVSLTVMRVKTMDTVCIDNLDEMQQFLESWRENYFNSDFNLEEFYDEED
jgi:hypothetical protein